MEIVVSLFTLVILEIVLGVDNLVFVAIAASRLPREQQGLARLIGLLLALVLRLVFLGGLVWIANFITPLFTLFEIAFSGRDLLLLGGGVFLLYKGTAEIHSSYDVEDNAPPRAPATFFWVICQIMLLDFVFSFDSVLTAIGLASQYWIMASAIIISMILMVFSSRTLAKLIETYPSIKILALSFILMVGMILCADGLHFHVPRGYVYFSMTFSILVETLNIVMRKKRKVPS